MVTLIPGTERETCMFFSKTGTCRFGDRCSRGHPHPEISNTLLFHSMYNHFELEQGLKDDLDTTDVTLEYDDGELYQNFQDFYHDIVPEFRNYGKLIQVKVCNNYEPHLRGNVYVQYKSENSAQEALMNLNGRFYGGKQVSCQFVEIKKWKSAICGLFRSGRCPKGRNCNFLHVFKNPNNEFWNADMDNSYEATESTRSRRHRSRSRSPSRSYRSSSRRIRRSRSRSSESQRYYAHEHYKSRYSRSRSRSRERSRVRSGKKSKRSRSRSRSVETSRSKRDRKRRSCSGSNGRSRSRSKMEKKREINSRSKSRSQSRSRRDKKRRSRSGSAPNTGIENPAAKRSEENSVDINNLENEQILNLGESSNGLVNCEEMNKDIHTNGDNVNSITSSMPGSPKHLVKKHKKHKKHKHKKKSNTVSESD